MSSTIDQHEYLKKYLSSAKSLKKRNKVKKKNAVRVNIIDDDLDLVTFNEAVTADLTGLEVEDAPQIVGVTDERPLELRVNDYKTDMWKSVTVLDSDEEDDEIKARRNEKAISPSRVKVEPRDYDNSPPRRNSGRTIDDNNVAKKISNPSGDYDNSPPRKSSKKNSSALSFEHKNKKYVPDDIRKNNRDQRIARNEDNSPTRNLSKNSDERMTEEHRNSKKRVSRWHKDDRNSDCSPPRKVASRSGDDSSPPRRRNNDNNCDYPRRNNNESNDNDNNPARESNKLNRNQENSRIERDRVDNSPPRKVKQTNDNDKSSSRAHSDRVISPPRIHRRENKSSSRRKDYESYKYDKSRDSKRDNRSSKCAHDYNKSRNNPSASKTKDNESDERNPSYRKHEGNLPVSSIPEPSLGRTDKSITSQGSMEIELDLVKKEACENEIAPKTIVRDRKTGRIRNLQEEAVASKEKKKEKEALEEKYSRWGKGLKQVDDANEKRTLDLYEMQKPLARYADDTDLENMLKNREREGDPMLEYLRKKRREKALKDPDAQPEKPTYQGDNGPPNRYGIRPGYRWDGVNRSNGFENKYFEVQNARRAHQTESYKWSSEDM